MSADTEPRVNSGLPEGRYGTGRNPKSRRWRRWLFSALGLIAGGLIAYVGYQNLASAPITAQRLGFLEKPDNSMEVTIDVQRDDSARAAVCIVRVRDRSGAESGRREFLVPPHSGTNFSTVVRSIDRPVTADVFGCSYDVPAYLSTP